jgi:flagellar basal-body rod protein FlgG
VINTDNALDMAIDGPGFFQVTMPDGSTAYTRNGSFTRNQNGEVVTSNGYVVNPAIQIPADAANITIGRDGTISATVGGDSQVQQLGQIQVATFPNSAGLQPMGESFYRETVASGAPLQANPGDAGAGKLLQGSLESSNVNVVEELVNMIETQRAYELNSKAISNIDAMMRNLTQST